MTRAAEGTPGAPSLGLVWAQAHDGVVGRDGAMPWHLPEDLRHFRRLTRGATVVMGRLTWLSLPERFRPLPGRRNVVLSRQPSFTAPGAQVRRSLDDAVGSTAPGEPVWVIGGAQVWAAALSQARRVVVTEIDTAVDGDTYAPHLDDTWQRLACDPPAGWHESVTGLRYRFVEYARLRSHARPPGHHG